MPAAVCGRDARHDTSVRPCSCLRTEALIHYDLKRHSSLCVIAGTMRDSRCSMPAPPSRQLAHCGYGTAQGWTVRSAVCRRAACAIITSLTRDVDCAREARSARMRAP